MKEDVQQWMMQAKDDLENAKILFDNKKYNGASVFCQQSVEKALKAVFIAKNKKLPSKTHDVSFLSQKVNLPQEFSQEIEPLTEIYMENRYPDVHGKELMQKERVDSFIKSTAFIFTWYEKQILSNK